MERAGRAVLFAFLATMRATVATTLPARHMMLVQRSIRVQAPLRNTSHQVSNITGQQASTSNMSSHNASEAWRRRIEAGAEPGSVERSIVVSSLGEQIEEEILLELDSGDTSHLRSKVVLTVVEMLGLGICGVDRCAMGQGCLGVIKGATAGGLLVWALLDFVLVVVNSLSFSHHLHALGYKVIFESSTVTAAFWLCLVLLTAQICSAYRLWRNISSRYADAEGEQEAGKPEGTQRWTAAAAAAAPSAAGVPDAQAANRPSSAKPGAFRAFWTRVGLGCSGEESAAPGGARRRRGQGAGPSSAREPPEAPTAAGGGPEAAADTRRSGAPGEAAAGPAPHSDPARPGAP